MFEDVYWQKYAARFKSFPSVLKPKAQKAEMAVCIPVYAEPNILTTLESLWNCDSPECVVDVLICFNKNEAITPEELSIHNQTWKDVTAWVEKHQHETLRFIPFYLEELPDPKGGVGWARKLVMDEAARRLDQEGVMVCLDADCTVAANYLREVYRHFVSNPKCEAASIYYEHPYEMESGEIKKAIVDYELHLRYLVHVLRWTEHPFAFQTVGSSMAVRRSGYLAHGGMNTRMAGEDFYFLQKFIEVGSLQEIKTTAVYPSARISYRVPFGTGRAMNYLLSGQDSWTTTSFESYKALAFLIQKINQLRQLCLDDEVTEKEPALREVFADHPELLSYLDENDFFGECQKIVDQTASLTSYRKRFFRYFNAFRVMRFTHYMRDHFYPDLPVEDAVSNFLFHNGTIERNAYRAEDFLLYFRKQDGHMIQ